MSVKQARPVVARNKSLKNRPTNPASLEPLGLGYTLYAKNPQGRPERVDPRRVFNTGDEIRFVVEANQALTSTFSTPIPGAHCG